MESWISGLTQHGYLILFTAVFLEAVGLPVPAALALLIAGAAAAGGSLWVSFALGGALLAMLTGDTLMFLLGRYTGWWLLGMLCRISLNPESCILRSADSFYRRGRALLVIAKFIPGINTMAPPLAGSMNMRFLTFLRLDLAGVVLYVGAYFSVGFIFSGALVAVTRGYQAFGRVMAWTVVALITGYVGFQVWLWIKSRSLRPVPLTVPSEVALEMSNGTCVVYDARSHGYFDARAMRIRGSKRLDPNALHVFDEKFPDGSQVYLYCTCAREATSTRVARELRERLDEDRVRIAVIRGGFRAWKKAGLPLEAVPSDDIRALPIFE
jgi:membrane protein DedA with SNARE-associated domain/rhodanese-related sulfurtransferase